MRLPLAGPTRATVVVLGWIAAAAVAGFIGVTAIGAVGDGIVGSSTTPLSADQVDQQLAAQVTTATISSPGASTPPSTPAQTSAPGGTSTQPSTTQPPPQGQSKVFTTDGGSVVARCNGATAQIVSATGAQGFTVKKEQDEGVDRASVEFESDAQDLKVRVEITCSGGVPAATVEQD